MDTTFIAGMLLVIGWGLFFYGANWMRRQQWRRGPFVLFWCSTALLGVSTFCFAAAPLLSWGQIAWLMITGVVVAVGVSAILGVLRSEPRTTTAKAADVERAAPTPVKGWAVPSFSDMMTGAPQWSSPTIASIEAMEVA